jgi:3-dehydroquinate dehydratase-2
LSVLIINGPNLNLLGTREPEIYGSVSFKDYLKDIRNYYDTIEIEYYQSNVEGELINRLHAADKEGHAGIVFNPGGYAHTSVALADAIASINTDVIIVHISNIYHREQERHKELLAQYAKGGIYGLGMRGYKMAVQSILAE